MNISSKTLPQFGVYQVECERHTLDEALRDAIECVNAVSGALQLSALEEISVSSITPSIKDDIKSDSLNAAQVRMTVIMSSDGDIQGEIDALMESNPELFEY